MAAEENVAAASSDLTLSITRIFDAPRHRVYQAWSVPEQMARWHGPRGYKTTIIASDFRVGGFYRLQMRDPDGHDHWTQGEFREIVEPERLVMTGCWTDAEGKPTTPETVVTVTFDDLGDKTRLTLRQTGFDSIAARDGHHGGWSSAFDCLADYLAA